MGGVWVTSATRTLADLSRVDDAPHARAAMLLAGSTPGLTEAAIRWLEAHASLPHRRAALTRLKRLADQDDVTRYTS
jgi:hypothetical protein